MAGVSRAATSVRAYCTASEEARVWAIPNWPGRAGCGIVASGKRFIKSLNPGSLLRRPARCVCSWVFDRSAAVDMHEHAP